MKHGHMRNPIMGLLFTFVTTLLFSGIALADSFLQPEQAFQLTAQLQDAKTVAVSWVIAPGYHLYRDRLNFKAVDGGVKLGEPTLPAGIKTFDTNFNKEVETYQNQLAVVLPVEQLISSYLIDNQP